MASLLNDLTVLEFGAGSQPAAVAGVVLADFGARVIKVEPPYGDRLREDDAAAFLVHNRGKESLVADLHTDEGKRVVQEVAKNVDVVLCGFRPGTPERFGVDYETLSAANPGLVYCAITGFGREGRYSTIKAYEHVVQAKSGFFTLGEGGMFGYRPGPIFVNAPMASTGAAQGAVAGVVAALINREKTGRGQLVDATLVQGLTPADYFGMFTWQLTHSKVAVPEKPETDPAEKSGKPTTVVASRYSFMPCTADGRWVFFTALLRHQMMAILRALELEHIVEDPRFANTPQFASAEDADAFETAIWEQFRTRTFEEWDPRLRAEKDVAYELARTSEEGLDHPQVKANGEAIVVEDPVHGPIKQLAPIAHMSATPPEVRSSAPSLGEHGDLTVSPKVFEHKDGEESDYPLAGMTILEFGYFYAMPFAMTMLASLGARVIKIEDANGDPFRHAFGAPEAGAIKAMEGKESLSVDLRSDEGRAIVHKLVRKADAFVNGFRPGVAERLGVDAETLSEINPRLVYFHAAGYGAHGELADRPIFAQCASAVAGAVPRQGGQWADPVLTEGMGVAELQALFLPRLKGPTDGDSNAALTAASALALGLLHQLRTGTGQKIETSMLGGNLWAYSDDTVVYPGKPERPVIDGDYNGFSALYRLYRAAEGVVFLAIITDSEWRNLCSVPGLESLAEDGRFATAESRRSDDAALASTLQDLFRMKTAPEWEELCVEREVACVAAFEATNSEFVNTDPVMRDTGLVAEVDHPVYGRMLRHAPVVSFSRSDVRIEAACTNGQHTENILRELGYDDSAINRLVEAGDVFLAKGESLRS